MVYYPTGLWNIHILFTWPLIQFFASLFPSRLNLRPAGQPHRGRPLWFRTRLINQIPPRQGFRGYLANIVCRDASFRLDRSLVVDRLVSETIHLSLYFAVFATMDYGSKDSQRRIEERFRDIRWRVSNPFLPSKGWKGRRWNARNVDDSMVE